ncbi:MAG: hypothetical protein C0442_10980, partial [Chlorobiaceae bacterium]|nr:hypothetical protein [Chlorobiaceae bacterium]
MLANLKIWKKLALGFGVSIMFLVVTIVIGLGRLSAVDDQAKEIVEFWFSKTVLANEMIDGVNDNAIALRNMIISDDPAVKANALERFAKVRELVTKNVGLLQEQAVTTQERELLAALMKIRKEFLDERTILIKELDAGNKELAIAMLMGKLGELLYAYIQSINDLVIYQTEKVNAGA